MGGRGSYSYTGKRGDRGLGSNGLGDYSRGAVLAKELGVSERQGAEMYDAINRWADGSTGIKNAQRGTGIYTEQNEKDAKTLDEFIEKSPSYQGELIRVMNIKGYEKPRKNGTIRSDGSITSWTVPSNYRNALNGFGFTSESGQTVVYHVKATKGADTRRYSRLTNLDGEILQSRKYESALKVDRVQTKTEISDVYPDGRKIIHVYLRE